ncbi:MAG: cytochrome d ubiquinol oxidase subunit II [Candidatus Egerieousia sp.]
MTTYHLLQLYWWTIVSLLAGILVFLMFVQGGQTLIAGTAKNENQRKILLRIFGHKWELTFTTLVLVGGALFASFPLYYSTSFGGAYWLWILILLSFVLQAVSYEFRSKEKNLLGSKTYDIFLIINGFAGTILLGVAVASFFTGGNFAVDKMSLANSASTTISYWTNDWKGLELIANGMNILLGAVVFLAARTLGLLYVINQALKMDGDKDAEDLAQRAYSKLAVTSIAFVLTFVVFVLQVFMMTGYKVNTADPSFNGITGEIFGEKYAYLHNMLDNPWVAAVFVAGVVLVLVSLYRVLRLRKSSFYMTGLGVVLAVFALLLCAGYGDTSFFHSNGDIQNSLTLYNSSSSFYTLKTMAYVSIAVPFVLLYIVYVWRKMTLKH